MKGTWKPYSNIICDQKMYIAGRQLDMSQPLHGGNIEYHGHYTEDSVAVEKLCAELNAQEK